MRKFSKNIVKEFQTGFGRFAAIMIIIAIGVGFLIGVIQATPDMKNTMSSYLIENNASDVSVKGTFGLTQEDADKIAALDCVETVTPVLSTDFETTVGGKEFVVRLNGLDLSSEYLNTLTIVEGRMPEKGKNEVVVIRSTNKFEKIAVGTEITIDTENATYGDVYAQTTLTVVGIVSSPDYYYVDGREISSLGTGVAGSVLYGYAEDVYDLQKSGSVFSLLKTVSRGELEIAYTDCWIKVKGAEEYRHFDDGYKNYVLDQSTAIESLGALQSQTVQEQVDALRNMASMMGQEVSLADAEWYVLDRASTNVSYVSFALNCEKVEEIAGVFPVFFILVAALVALTSMTRMVEEDRMQIGTFKALGYGKGKIISKYLIYCCLAALIGCVAGILCGFALLPSIFWRAYGTLYQLPALSFGFSWILAIAVFGISLAGTALVTWGACFNSLKEKPSALMQPKAPKPGKRILLERIPFLWKPLKFKWKATIRNIFRYKKNMLLTIVSVMGCTALMLTGFGLSDSVNAVTDIQYGKVLLYDTAIEYTGDLAQSENEALNSLLSDLGEENYLAVYKESGRLIFGTGKDAASETVDLYVVEDSSAFNQFVSLHNRKNSAIIDIDESGQNTVVLPENIAKVYGLEKGGTLSYSKTGEDPVEVTVCAVCENYTGSYAYMSASVYKALFGKDAAANTLLLKTGLTADEGDDMVRDVLSGNKGDKFEVTSVEFTSTEKDTFAGLSSTMGMIIAVLVISAGALAAIVLYNLTNINIDERRREIATLRVLGYRKAEVAGYIYRESAILTVAGALLGLGLGFLLHMFIINRVNSVSMMFGSAIAGLSYLWSFLLTLAFAAIVYAFMLIKLNRINMAESLKSNE